MPASTGTYNAWGPYARDILKGLITPETANRYKALLVTSAFSPNLDVDQYLAAAQVNEVYEGDWTQGGLVLANVAVALDTINNRVSITHDAINASECTFASPGASRLIIYDDLSGGSAATKRLAFTASLSAPLLPVAGPVAISSPNGIVRSNY